MGKVRAGVRVVQVGTFDLRGETMAEWAVQCTHPYCDEVLFEGAADSANRTRSAGHAPKAAAEELARWHRHWHTQHASRLAKEREARS